MHRNVSRRHLNSGALVRGIRRPLLFAIWLLLVACGDSSSVSDVGREGAADGMAKEQGSPDQVVVDQAATDQGSDASATLPLGTASAAASAACPSSALATNLCARVTVSGCRGVSDASAIVKLTFGAAPVAGTIVFGTGGSGTGFYESNVTARDDILVPLQQAGYQIVQRAWERPGWIPGADGVGIAARACLHATLLEFIHTTRHSSGGFCAQGHSAGATELAYALTRYGLGTILDQVVFAAGPPGVRLDYACMTKAASGWNCQQPPGCTGRTCTFTAPTAQRVDDTYETPTSQRVVACQMHDASWQSIWRSDSVLSPSAQTTFPNTQLRLVNGDSDCGSGVVAQAGEFLAAVSGDVSQTLLAGVGHGVPGSTQGAAALLAAHTSGCVFRH